MSTGALKIYLEQGVRDVEGWLHQGGIQLTLHLDALQKEMGVEGDIVEFGVWQGKYLILLALLARENERVIGFDSFVHARPAAGCEARFWENVARFVGDTDRVRLVKIDTQTVNGDVLKAFSHGVRLFSVDAGHMAGESEHDFEVAAAALVPGGIVLADDFMNHRMPGVTEGILAFFSRSPERHRIAPIACGANKLFCTTSSHADRYRAALTQLMAERTEDPFFVEARNWKAVNESLDLKAEMCGSPIVLF